MTRDVAVLRSTAAVHEVARLLSGRGISAVPLVDPAGRITGVVSRTDLIRAGQLLARPGRGNPVLELPERPAAIELITRVPLICAPDTSVRDAARQMLEHRVHRLFVVEDRRPVGVISTLDLTAAVRDARPEGTIAEIMSSPVLTIHASAPIGAAVAELERAHVTALVVVDDRWPIGMLTQTDALAARDLPRETPVEDLMDAAVICMPSSTLLHRAATQAARLDVRSVIGCRDRDVAGIVTGLDFGRIVAA